MMKRKTEWLKNRKERKKKKKKGTVQSTQNKRITWPTSTKAYLLDSSTNTPKLTIESMPKNKTEQKSICKKKVYKGNTDEKK